VIYSPDPETDKQPADENIRDVRGLLSDVLLADRGDVYMRHVKLDLQSVSLFGQDWGGAIGLSVVARVHRREDLWTGPHVARAPDLVLELATPQGQGLSLVPTPWQEPGGPPAVRTLGEDELAGGRGRGMNGTHRPDGILIACGGSAGRPHFVAQPRLTDVAPAVLTYMGVHAERGRDEGSPERIEYAPEEDELVARRLRALGYLE